MFALKTRTEIKLAAAAAIIAAGSFAAPAIAGDSYMPPQGQAQQQHPGQAAQGQAEVSDEQLQAFAEAQDAIRNVQTKYQSQAADVTSEAEVRTLQEQMNTEMIEEIESSGLNVEEYRTITAALQTDPSVQEKYNALTR